jgi:ABC-2 type transport system permease protein
MTKRNIFTFFEIIFFPVVGFLSVGLLAEFTQLQPEMTAFILLGVIAMGAVQVCQLDVCYALLYDVWSKAVKHGFIAPIGIRHMLFGSLIMGIIRGSVVFLILMLASYILFDFNFMVPGVSATCLFAFGLFLNGAMIGLLVCILVLIFGNRAEVAAFSLVSLMLLVCGIYYPVSILPKGIMFVAEAIPLTFFLEYFRQFYGFEPTFQHALAKGYIMVFFYLFMEVLLLKLAIRKAKKRGTLLKLSE